MKAGQLLLKIHRWSLLGGGEDGEVGDVQIVQS